MANCIRPCGVAVKSSDTVLEGGLVDDLPPSLPPPPQANSAKQIHSETTLIKPLEYNIFFSHKSQETRVANNYMVLCESRQKIFMKSNDLKKEIIKKAG